ncbi:MAG TPA: hypothetical protein VJ022_00460 [Anaerolineales bacterium]|nr:hypothetical protein [Anaerolineales bacterium]
MILTLLVTILIEGTVVLAYSALRKRPAGPLLFASFIVNVFTQGALWVALQIFFRQYLTALFVAEILIWLIESLLLYHLSRNQLRPVHALILSLCMNLASFGIGWFLPV